MPVLHEIGSRVFAVVPAAGHSRRMGTSKLLLPFHGRTVIRGLIDALASGGVTATFVLAREDDRALRAELANTSARVLTASRPTRDMRESVQALIDGIEREVSPGAKDAWLLCPADYPLIGEAVVQALLDDCRVAGCGIRIPTTGGRRGHPTLFAWPYAERVRDIPQGQGINWLIRQYADEVVEVPVNSPGVLCDLDTPEDWESLLRTEPDASPRAPHDPRGNR